MTRSAIIADADLTVRAGTGEGHLSGSGSHLAFETPHLAAFLATMPGESARGIRSVARGLASMGLSVGVIEDGVAVLDMGDGHTSLLARAFGFQHVRIRRPLRLLARYLWR